VENEIQEASRIGVTTKGIEIDSSQGNILTESIILGVIVLVVSILYVGKKIVDKKFS